jgi:Fur family ferric uptake transcriptional regulator
VLEGLGLVRHAHLSDRAPTYHSTRGHEHFHLVCRDCHKVVSVNAEDAAPFVESLATRHAFSPDLGHLTVFGRCHDCEGNP